MNPPTLPAAPWTAPQIPDSRAIVTGDGYFLLNLEGLDATPEQAAALRRAVAALPDCLAALNAFPDFPDDFHPHCPGSVVAFAQAVILWRRQQSMAALLKAGQLATVPPTAAK